MMKRLVAVAFIFGGSTIAWIILTASIQSRTKDSGEKLRTGVSSTWGSPQEQWQPVALLNGPEPVSLDAEQTRVRVDLNLDYRQKGLLWYSTYVVQFAGKYRFRNPSDQERRVLLNFRFPAQQALYDDLAITADGRTVPFTSNQDGANAWADVAGGQLVEFRVAYRSHGLDDWQYRLGKDITRAQDFELTLGTNFRNIDFPASTLSPTDKQKTNAGWEMEWSYRNLISGFAIGMTMPQRLQPGPLAGEISAFAPVSLLLFFFVLLILTTLRQVELHPVNYFFLAAAFFAFHLLLAYLVDHVSIFLAFAMASLVSVGLVVSYLRLVVGPRFAVAEAGAAQMLYLVLFSASFFLRGFTGLAITIGCIATLFVAMQLTAEVRWREHFALGEVRQ